MNTDEAATKFVESALNGSSWKPPEAKMSSEEAHIAAIRILGHHFTPAFAEMGHSDCDHLTGNAESYLDMVNFRKTEVNGCLPTLMEKLASEWVKIRRLATECSVVHDFAVILRSNTALHPLIRENDYGNEELKDALRWILTQHRGREKKEGGTNIRVLQQALGFKEKSG